MYAERIFSVLVIGVQGKHQRKSEQYHRAKFGIKNIEWFQISKSLQSSTPKLMEYPVHLFEIE